MELKNKPMMTPPSLLDPHRWSGLRIGLFGGTFNPPHKGHIHASEIAIKYLGLDALWWLVSSGNPLKSSLGLPSLEDRVAACRDLSQNPRIVISDIESALKTTRSFHTIKALKVRFPHTEFVWCAGLDIAQEFHRWYRWQDLPKEIPFAFIGRPIEGGGVRQTALHHHSNFQNIFLRCGGHPKLKKGRIYWILEEPLNPLSSTLLRAQSDDLRYFLHQGRIRTVALNVLNKTERSV